MVVLAVDLQPFASVPVTVYWVVLAGVAAVDPAVLFVKPVIGDHTYVSAPDADKVVDLPEQIATDGLLVICGNELTVMATLMLSVHPLKPTKV